MFNRHKINVLNPERHGGDGLNNSYISYEITSQFERKEFKVRRRYQDFLWLVDQLKDNFPERIIPPLPDKNRLEYLGRFTPDFIKRRQLGLKRFLWRIDSHPKLGECETFQNFLKAQIVGLKGRCNSEASITCETKETNTSTSSLYLKPVIDSLGDVLSATSIFSRSPKLIPEQFLKLKKEIKMVKSHLSHLERLFNNRVTGHQPAIIEGMKEIAENFDELSASIDLSFSSEQASETNQQISPPFVKSMLSRVSATMTQCAHLLDKSIDDQELNLLAVLLEYSQYCDSALEIIETRDRRQVEVEELTKLVEGYEKEIEELEGVHKDEHVKSTDNAAANNSNVSSTTSTHSAHSGSFLNYLSSKWDSWKGVDPITARKNRLEKTQTKLKDAQSALKTSQHLSSLLDSTLSNEIAIFLRTLREELGRELLNHSGSQVNYHETNLVYWRDFLDWLDNPPKHL